MLSDRAATSLRPRNTLILFSFLVALLYAATFLPNDKITVNNRHSFQPALHGLNLLNANRALFDGQQSTPNTGSLVSRADPSSESGSDIIDYNEPTDPDDDLTYDHAVSKGNNYISLMDTEDLSSCDEVQQSTFTRLGQLSENGWKMTRSAPPSAAIWNSNGIVNTLDDAIKPLSFSADNQHSIQIDWEHNTEVTINGKKYVPTIANYLNRYTTDGAIFALANYSPRRTALNHEPPIVDVPPLQAWSDVVFLNWQNVCRGDARCMKGLSAVVRCRLSNSATKRLLTTAFGSTLGPFPGKTVQKGLKEHAALLGAPNGRGVAWLLLQHRQQLGWKYVEAIQVYTFDDEYFIVYHIKDNTQTSHTNARSVGPNTSRVTSRAASEGTIVSTGNATLDLTPIYPRGDLLRRGVEYDSFGPNSESDTDNEPDYDRLYDSSHNMAYVAAQAKGGALIKFMEAAQDSDCVQQSKFTELKDLAASGWRLSENIKAGFTRAPDFMVDIRNALNAMNEPIDDDHNLIISWTHDQTTASVDRQITFFPTSAHYRNAYCQNGIIAMDIEGPVKAGGKQNPPVDGLTRKFPPLKQWSDVTFLQWQDFCKTHSFGIKDVRFIVQSAIDNPQTEQTILDVFKVTEVADLPNLPGKTFSSGSQEFAALLATPNGQGSAWLLSQHKEQLGVKTVQSIQIWAVDEFSLFMCLHIGDYQGPSESERRRGVSSVASNDRNSLKESENSPAEAISSVAVIRRGQPEGTRGLVKRLDKTEFDALATKGKDLVAALQSPEVCIPQSEWTNYDDMTKWGWAIPTWFKKSEWPYWNDQAFKDIYASVGASTGKSSSSWKMWQHKVETKETNNGQTTTYYPTDASYNNFYNPLVIIANSNTGPAANGRWKFPPVTGEPGELPIPKLSHWSDFAFLDYQNYMTDSNMPMSKLKAVWRKTIINGASQRLMEYILGKERPLWPGKQFGSETDEFAALLRSPNGQGVAYLVLQHRKQLGLKTITSVRVFYNRVLEGSDTLVPNLVWTIADLQTGTQTKERRSLSGPLVLSVTEQPAPLILNTTLDLAPWPQLYRRAALDPKKVSAQQLVDEARDSGKYLVTVQEADTETLKSCLNIDQSTFTDHTSLAKHGWTSHDGAKNADSDITGHTVEDSWKLMGLDWKGSKLKEVQWKHTDRTEGTVDGRPLAYLPTQAYFKNAYCPEGIVAVNNKSPPNIGSSQNPKVDGTTNPYPPLKQWSDVNFLEYKEQCHSDAACMKKLKGVLRYQVSNAYTKKALNEFMGKTNPMGPGGFYAKTWPGTTYKLGEDGFNVVLGMPGGKGVAYLLAQHREQVGWKEVYEIRVFSETAMFQILYLIRDHSDAQGGSQRRNVLIATPPAISNVVSKMVQPASNMSTQLDPIVQGNDNHGQSVGGNVSSLFSRWAGSKIMAARSFLGSGVLRVF